MSLRLVFFFFFFLIFFFFLFLIFLGSLIFPIVFITCYFSFLCNENNLCFIFTPRYLAKTSIIVDLWNFIWDFSAANEAFLLIPYFNKQILFILFSLSKAYLQRVCQWCLWLIQHQLRTAINRNLIEFDNFLWLFQK